MTLLNHNKTPRTDANTFNEDGKRPTGEDGEILSVPADFARQLERENQTFRAAQKACEDCDAPRVDRIDELERELAAARATHAALYAGTLKLERELAREKQRAEGNGILAHDTALALATAHEALEWARGELGKHTRPSPIDKALAPASDLGESNDEPGRTNELMATLAQQSAVAIQKHHSKILSERQTGLEPYGRKGKDDL